MARRHDGRADLETRAPGASLGMLDRADGSAQFGFGPSSALASVSGPIEVRLNKELPDGATFEIVHRPLEGVGATPSRAFEATLALVFPPLLNLGAHPRTLVQLVVQSLSPAPLPIPTTIAPDHQTTWPPDSFPAPGSAAPILGMFSTSCASAINASTLALLDSGAIAMRAVPIAVGVAYLPDGRLVLDPTNEEERKALSRHVFAWAFGRGISTRENQGDMDVDDEREAEIVLVQSEGDFSRQELDAALRLGRVAATDLLAFFREQVAAHLAKRLT